MPNENIPLNSISEVACLHDTNRTRVVSAHLKAEGAEELVVFKRFRVVDEYSISRFETEVKLLTFLSQGCPHVVKPLGIVLEAPVYGIVEPFFRFGSLGDLLRKTPLLKSEARICSARDLTCAVCYCHQNGVIVRDIKPDNLFVVNQTIAGCSIDRNS